MATAQAQTRDFQIPSPGVNRSASPPAVPSPSVPAPAGPSGTAPLPTRPGPAGTTAPAKPDSVFANLTASPPSQTEMMIGAGVVLVLALALLFVRSAAKSHLVRRRAPPDAASGASWMLFTALFLTALVLVSGTVGRVWRELAISVPALVVCFVLLAISARMFVRAPAQTR